MVDREKVIEGFDICLKNIDSPDCPSNCPYFSDCSKYENRVVFQPLMRDALAMLKEQETEWEHLWDAPDGTFKGRCKKCGFVHFFIEGHDEQYKFCPECGRAVKW